MQSPLKRFKLLAQDTQIRSSLAVTAAANSIDNELLTYFTDLKECGCGKRRGLDFWICHETKYQLLAPLAEDLLSAPASEAYVERVFSVCGDLTAGKRNRLSKNLEKRAFLKMNQKYYL